MPSKNKGKTKAPVHTVMSSKPGKSVTTPAPKLDDVSHLLFASSENDKSTHDIPFIGPIALVDQRQCDSASQQVVHGRGLVVTRDVPPGECLFIIPAIVSTPIDEVHRRFLDLCTHESRNNQSGDKCYGKELEEISETVLVERIQSLCEEDDSERMELKRKTFASFILQMSSDDLPNADLDVLLARASSPSYNQSQMTLDNETILNIIRRNAFGPDYHSYDTIASCWLKNPSNLATELTYKRLLGIYPLAAMINHSCSPNAVRIFGNVPASLETHELRGREVMIVHASAAIKKGSEIVWSYFPPTIPFDIRHETSKKYGFSCKCTRCTSEQKAVDGIQLFDRLATTNIDRMNLPITVQSIEAALAFQNINSEIQRYLRISYARIYMEYFNEALASPLIKSIQNNDEMSKLLKLTTQLHFAFVSCNNASTEHISILHLCYELASLMHNNAVSYFPDTMSKTMSQVRFWTEQLKKVHMTRYGSLGENLESVRNVMKHSRAVLRSKDGWNQSSHGFI